MQSIVPFGLGHANCAKASRYEQQKLNCAIRQPEPGFQPPLERISV